MGCCNSKEPKAKKSVDAPPPVQLPQEVAPPAPVKSAADLRLERIQAARELPYRYNRCTVDGKPTALFEEGVAFSIHNDDDWYFYNDTLEYELHVDFRFRPGFSIVGGAGTTVEPSADGWLRAFMVVYPLETGHYISGRHNGHTGGVSLVPLSVEYRTRACRAADVTVQRELAAVQQLANGETNEEVVLQRCVERNTPYVDVNFTPTPEMLTRPGVDGRAIDPLPMMRPSMYLDAKQQGAANAFVDAVLPQAIDFGILGDCWLGCAVASLSENERFIRAMFDQTKPEERQVGAYRVSTSKNGWWQSLIVDNYLPTINLMPTYARSIDDARELWPSLLQKAYAKLHGSYASITGGDALQAIQDFTGDPTYRFDKEWESATVSHDAAVAFCNKLVQYASAGFSLVLSTPGVVSSTYLGSKCELDPVAFKAKYEGVGLRNGYTYFVSRVVRVQAGGQDELLLKVHNPWPVNHTWTGAWSAGAAEWSQNPATATVCDVMHDNPAEGTFWIAFQDAINYFDGGGVVYTTSSAIDYRVKGQFADTRPSVVLEVHASEPVEVMLVLSQSDKRGGTDPRGGRYAPIMLSVAKKEGGSYRVDQNSSWDAVSSSADYNFTVARDVAMKYTFEPNSSPYLVVPRIHRKGVVEGYDRHYVLGVIADKPLEGKVHIALKSIGAENRVFKNLITFDPSEDISNVEAEFQTHRTGQLAAVAIGDVLCRTPGAVVTKSEPIANEQHTTGSSKAALSPDGVNEEAVEAPTTIHDSVNDAHVVSGNTPPPTPKANLSEL